VVFEEYDTPEVKTVNGVATLGRARGLGSRTAKATCWPWGSSIRAAWGGKLGRDL
jgi:hypothetical protein